MDDDEKINAQMGSDETEKLHSHERLHPLEEGIKNEFDSDDEKTQELNNAAHIIERFGGIRPMSTKTHIAATTIQGWKQRGIIPASRRNEILQYAQLYEIELEDLLNTNEIPASPSPTPQATFIETENDPLPNRKVDEFAPKKTSHVKIEGVGYQTRAQLDDFQAHNNRQLYQMNSTGGHIFWLCITVILICLIGFAGYFIISPKFKDIDAQQQKIVELEKEVGQLRLQSSRALLQRQTSVEGADTTNSSLTSTLDQLQSKVEDLSTQAKTYAKTIDNFKNSEMSQRLQSVEESIAGISSQSRALGLQGFIYKIENLQNSTNGQEMLTKWMSELTNLAEIEQPKEAMSNTEEKTTQHQSPNFENLMAKMQISDPELSEAFQDVAPEDVKAAVMLMAMAQLRTSLERDRNSFDQDLTILKMTLAKDNPALADSIDKLAPKAKDGVLTPQGLSKEFRAMSGEIVADSLAGKDVSIQEKALAKIGNLVKVEKDGDQISGTATQIQIAEAQKLLDQGDIEGAMAVLQELKEGAPEGTQNQKIDSFINEAQATLMANNLQQNLQQNVAAHLKSFVTMSRLGKARSGGAYLVKPNPLDGLSNSLPNDLKSMITQTPSSVSGDSQ